MITHLINGKRVLAPNPVGITLENFLSFFSELNFREEFLTKSLDTTDYRFHLQNSIVIIDLSFFKRGFKISIFNNKEVLRFVHEYSNRIWTRTLINTKNTIDSHYVESDISPVLTSLIDDIRSTWEANK